MASGAPRHQFRPPDEPNDEAGDDQCDQEDAREHDPACRLVIRFCGCQHNVTLGVPLRCLARREGGRLCDEEANGRRSYRQLHPTWPLPSYALGVRAVDYQEFIGAKKHLVLGLSSQTGPPQRSNPFAIG